MSDLRRFFVKEVKAETEIDGEEFQHAINVLRIKEGDNIIICNNTENEYVARVKKINKKNFIAEIMENRISDKESKTDVMLICGYLKGDKTELVVQKAVELGIKKIVVFSSEYSSAYISENKLERLKRVAVEASKQCGRSISPEVFYADNFKKALEFGDSYKNKLFACEFATHNSVDFDKLKGDTAIVVGSEGGFSQQESEIALEKKYSTVSLGKRILRADTASIVLTGIVMHALGELE